MRPVESVETYFLKILSARLKRFDPQIWLPTLTLFWGIVSICQGLITNKAGLFGIRFRERVVHFSRAMFLIKITLFQSLELQKLVYSLVLFTCSRFIIAGMNEVGEWLYSSEVLRLLVLLEASSPTRLGRCTGLAVVRVGNGTNAPSFLKILALLFGSLGYLFSKEF